MEDNLQTPITYTYPCKECDNTTLESLGSEGHPDIAECTKCGHPNDTPSTSMLNRYQELLHQTL